MTPGDSTTPDDSTTLQPLGDVQQTTKSLLTEVEEMASGAIGSSLAGVIGGFLVEGSVTQSEADLRADAVVMPPSSDDDVGLRYDWNLYGYVEGRDPTTGAITVSTNREVIATVGSSDSQTETVRGSLGEFQSIGMRRSLDGGDEYYVSIFTDYEDGEGADEDYLTGGFWLHIPADQTDLDGYSFGAFSDGSHEFDFSSALRGSATYSGEAAGVCDCAGGGDTTIAPRVFEASAELVANFEYEGSTISGAITDFVVDGEALTGDRARSVSLLATDFDDSFFTGNASLDGSSDHGEWGGQFYGVQDASNAFPGSVGGTFGASRSLESGDIETFVGAFGAHRTASSARDVLFRDSVAVWRAFQDFTYSGAGEARTYAPLIEEAIADATERVPLRNGGQASSASVTGVDVDVSTTSGQLVYQWNLDDGSSPNDLELDSSMVTADDGYELYDFGQVGDGTFEGFSFIEINRTIADVAGSPPSLNVDQYFVNVFTDHDGSANDTDYLAGGVWLYVPQDFREGDYSFGAFADGNNPFQYQTATALEGSATYDGVAAGAYCECSDGATEPGMIGLFEADVALTADFGQNMISGSVTNFVLDGDTSDDTAIYLLETGIGDVAGGFFSGDTSFDETVSGARGPVAGKWGGNFYGDVNGENAPGSVAGTFGASSDTHSYLGAFGAYIVEE